MKTWLVSYADGVFRESQRRLVASAGGCGIDECRTWDRETLVDTTFYRLHRTVLDARRGAGYWLWKPFIIEETLKEAADDDLVVYADAGLEITGELSPLFEICRARAPLLLFAGHYDDVGAPGPNLCAKWTKRDCFVALDCDQPRYHDGQMLDASFIIVRKRADTMAFVREWLLHCARPRLITDEPNVRGLPNLRTFVEHRHDQSLLSLLAIREGLEIFRHPSQHGNHLKLAPYREPGEWRRYPYGLKGLYRNSPYGTLLNHHRGTWHARDRHVVLDRTMPAPVERVFSAWTNPDVLVKWVSRDHAVIAAGMDVRVGGDYQLTLRPRDQTAPRFVVVRGSFLEVEPPRRLAYSWIDQTTVTVDFVERESRTQVLLRHGGFASEMLREAHAQAWTSLLDTIEIELGKCAVQ